MKSYVLPTLLTSMLCGGFTVPTPESLINDLKQQANTRNTEKISSGSEAERIEATRQLRWNKSLSTGDKIVLLRKSLTDSAGNVRSVAAGSVAELAEDAAAKAAIPELRANLVDPYANAALNAAVALQRLGEPDDNILPAVRTIFKRDGLDLEERTFAASMMSGTGAPDEEVAPALVDGIASKKKTSRNRALKRLRKMKTMPINTIPHYAKVLASTDAKVLQYIGIVINQKFRPVPRALVAPAAAALQFGDLHANENLLEVIGGAGLDGAEGVPAIAALLKKQPLVSRNERVRGVIALGNIKAESDEAVDALLHVATTDPDAVVRHSARMSAATFTENTEKIRAHFEDLKQNGTEEEKNRAAGLLRSLDAWQQLKKQQQQ